MSDNQKKPIVILVNADKIHMSAVTEPKVVDFGYDRERDEPALQRTWERIRELKAQGLLKPTPKLPPGGIRLRGSRAKQSV